jgi:hypothetical protein
MKFPWFLAGILAFAAPATAEDWKLEFGTGAYDQDACFALGAAIEDFIGRPVDYRCRPDETGNGAGGSVDSPAADKGGVVPDPLPENPSSPVPGIILLPLQTDPSQAI